MIPAGIRCLHFHDNSINRAKFILIPGEGIFLKKEDFTKTSFYSGNAFSDKIVNLASAILASLRLSNNSYMGAEQIKKILHLRIEQASDSFLRILYAMTEAYASEHLKGEPTEGEIADLLANVDLKPLSQEEFIKEIELANAQIEKGKYTTLEDLEKEMEKW